MELQSKTDKFLWNVHFHNHDDLPDANVQPRHKFKYDAIQNTYQLRTKHYSKESTKSKPCRKYHPTACKEVKLHQKIAQFYNCTIPIFYGGQHLDEDILGGYTFFNILSFIVKKIISLTETHISGLQNCNISVTKKMTPLIDKCSIKSHIKFPIFKRIQTS